MTKELYLMPKHGTKVDSFKIPEAVASQIKDLMKQGAVIEGADYSGGKIWVNLAAYRYARLSEEVEETRSGLPGVATESHREKWEHQ